MTGETLVLVDPAAEPEAAKVVVAAPRLASLQGKRVALVDNSKHRATETLDAIEALLRDRYGVASFERYRKDNPSIATPPEVLRGLAERCDAVVHGVAD